LTIPLIGTIFAPSPCLLQGTLRGRHGTSARVAMDAAASGMFACPTKRLQRTAKSCGPGAATLASSRVVSPTPATVAKQAAHRGEHEVSRKTFARGRPGCPGCTCQTRVHSHCFQHTALRAQSAPGLPCALSSKRGPMKMQNPGNSCRGDERLCPHTRPSFRGAPKARAWNPYAVTGLGSRDAGWLSLNNIRLWLWIPGSPLRGAPE
jgi:hypothetical protein